MDISAYSKTSIPSRAYSRKSKAAQSMTLLMHGYFIHEKFSACHDGSFSNGGVAMPCSLLGGYRYFGDGDEVRVQTFWRNVPFPIFQVAKQTPVFLRKVLPRSSPLMCYYRNVAENSASTSDSSYDINTYEIVKLPSSDWNCGFRVSEEHATSLFSIEILYFSFLVLFV
jgi:hypothetical protein